MISIEPPSLTLPEIIQAGISIETIVYSVIIFFLLFVCAVMSGSESALFSLKPDENKKLKSETTKDSKTIIQLLSNPRELLATILIVNNFVLYIQLQHIPLFCNYEILVCQGTNI